ncbi:MAG TPA: ATP-binding cassette domain-containing protein, partial [Anaerolineae bacterium]
VELREIRKHFGPVRANDNVSLSVEPGTIHGLLGENGAGKSTLMKVLTGFITADGGEIRLDGQLVQVTSPAEAVQRGVGMLYQDPLDFAALTVLDNFVLGYPGGIIPDRVKARRDLRDLCHQFDFNLDPDAHVASLGIGERQQLEIVRLLWLGVRTLVLDEPTTAISAQQKAKLFSALRKLAEQGKTVIFVSHKLEEVEELCHKVTVMSRGCVTGEANAPYSAEQLVRMMFGQVVTLKKRSPVPLGEPVLQLHGVTVSDWRLEVKNLDLEIRAGEVIGLAGLEGSGQRLLLQVAAGLKRPTAGQVCLAGQDVTGLPYARYLKAGVSFMPAGRLEEGLIAGMTITEHCALAERSRDLVVNWPAAERTAVERIKAYNIKGRPMSRVEELSGGNQQRTLLGLLPPKLKLLLMEHPTRGLDLESIEYIWGLLLERTRQGTAIMFASADLDELLDRSDRILVFFSGRVASAVDARTTSVEQLGELIGGKGI